jgi:hypothetical protein
MIHLLTMLFNKIGSYCCKAKYSFIGRKTVSTATSVAIAINKSSKTIFRVNPFWFQTKKRDRMQTITEIKITGAKNLVLVAL